MAVAVASWGQRNSLWMTILRNDQLTLSGRPSPVKSREQGYLRRPPGTITEKQNQQNPAGPSEGQRQHAPQEGRAPAISWEQITNDPDHSGWHQAWIPWNDSVLSRVEARVDEHHPPALGGGVEHPPRPQVKGFKTRVAQLLPHSTRESKFQPLQALQGIK